jgi:ABC-2 type transport system permease protein
VSVFGTLYVRWMRDRTVSLIAWTVGILLIVVLTAAFYPSVGDTVEQATSGGGDGGSSDVMSTFLGLSAGIDPGSPLGFLWIGLYANIYPWMLMALGVSLGITAIAGDEETGNLEYLLSGPVHRTVVVFARFAGLISTLFIVSLLSAIGLIISLPLFDLTDDYTSTAADGSTVTSPGATAGDVFAGTFAAFAVALGLGAIAFMLGAAIGRKSTALGIATAVGVGGYVLYTLSEMTGDLESLTWLSPWRWYVDDAMLVNGLDWPVLLPFGTAVVSLLVGWQVFVRRDLKGG